MKGFNLAAQAAGASGAVGGGRGPSTPGSVGESNEKKRSDLLKYFKITSWLTVVTHPVSHGLHMWKIKYLKNH